MSIKTVEKIAAQLHSVALIITELQRHSSKGSAAESSCARAMSAIAEATAVLEHEGAQLAQIKSVGSSRAAYLLCVLLAHVNDCHRQADETGGHDMIKVRQWLNDITNQLHSIQEALQQAMGGVDMSLQTRTQLCRQLAKEMGFKLIEVPLAEHPEPESLKGIPDHAGISPREEYLRMLGNVRLEMAELRENFIGGSVTATALDSMDNQLSLMESLLGDYSDTFPSLSTGARMFDKGFLAGQQHAQKIAAPLHTKIDPTKDPKAWNEALALTMNPRAQDAQDLHDFRVALLPVVYAESTLDMRSETIADNVNRMAAVMLQRAKEADRES